MKGVVALNSLLAIPVVMFAADDQASYKVTYDGGSLSSVTSGSGLKLFAVPTGKGQGYFGDNAFQDIFYNDKKSFATPYFHRYMLDIQREVARPEFCGRCLLTSGRKGEMALV